jgi:hypothetical protein
MRFFLNSGKRAPNRYLCMALSLSADLEKEALLG